MKHNCVPTFVHLNVHTEYSLVDGISRVKKLAEGTRYLSMPAVAMTDVSNLYAAVKFYSSCVRNNIKPLFGIELNVAGINGSRYDGSMIFLCKDNVGFRALSQMVSDIYIRPRNHDKIQATHDDLMKISSHVLVLSGGIYSGIAKLLIAGHRDEAVEQLTTYKRMFKDAFYLEISRTGKPEEETYEQEILPIARLTNTPIVATNMVRFIGPDDFEAHEIRTCIYESKVLDDPRRPRVFSEQQFLRSPEEMVELFNDLPSAIENTVQIAKRCNVFFNFEETHMPQFPLGKNETAEGKLIHLSQQGLKKHLQVLSKKSIDIYQTRLDTELKTINSMGFAGYFLIVADFVKWAQQNGVPVGPGRGSGAGSLVAFALGITKIDPIHYGLLFERFLNSERVSLPDFDIDFCMVGRDRVIDYVTKKYGADRVAQIITYNSLAARAVVRDVGRVMGNPYGFCDTLAKLVPFEIGMTLERALHQDDELEKRYKNEPEVTQLIDNAMKLEGMPRNAGKHAGGLVISPTAISDFSPLYWEPGMTQAVTQFDKDDLESIGLVKFDFLGLRTLTIIDWAVDIINKIQKEKGEKEVKVDELQPNDKNVYDLISTGNTTALFQLESRGMQELIQRLKPDHFEELIALVALFRPGPLQSGMVDDFINRKHGREPITYIHDSLKIILESTYGVILYQEQVMQIAQELAGYSLGSADLLRRAMGKKKPEEMETQRQVFIDGCNERGVSPFSAKRIFDLIEKFAGYGFNKSHSAAYAMLSYQTAWLKCYYPSEFMSAALSADMEHTDKVVHLIDESKSMKLNILPPSINHGKSKFQVDPDGNIIYGLGAIKGVGDKALENIVDQRNQYGQYQTLLNFCERVDTSKVNRKTIESLICGGAFDCLAPNRAQLLSSLSATIDAAGQQEQNLSSGQNDMFGLSSVDKIIDSSLSVEEWTPRKKLEMERISLGYYLTGHPIDHHYGEMKNIITGSIAEISAETKKSIVIAGIVSDVRTFQNRKGETIAFGQIKDNTGVADISLYGQLYFSSREAISMNGIVIIKGMSGRDERSGNLSVKVDSLFLLSRFRQQFLSNLILQIPSSEDIDIQITELRKILNRYRGGATNVLVGYTNSNGDSAELKLGHEWKVKPEEELLDSLVKLIGQKNIKYKFDLSLMDRQV